MLDHAPASKVFWFGYSGVGFLSLRMSEGASSPLSRRFIVPHLAGVKGKGLGKESWTMSSDVIGI